MEQANELGAKRAYRIEELSKLGGPGRDKAYEEIKGGRLRAVKLGARTVILVEDFEQYLKTLPPLDLSAASKLRQRARRARAAPRAKKPQRSRRRLASS